MNPKMDDSFQPICLQNFAVENNALANRVAEEAKKASEVAKERAAQAEAQVRDRSCLRCNWDEMECN